MASLRDLLDCKAVDTQDKGDVFKHLEQTKRSQLSYKMDRIKLHQKLAPARQMMQLVDQEHPLDSDAGMGMQPQVDQFGNPIPNDGNNIDQGKAMQTAPGANSMNPGMPQKPMTGKEQNMAPKGAKTSSNTRPGGGTNSGTGSNKSKSKSSGGSKSSSGGKGRFEISVKGQGKRIDQLNVRKKKMKGNDYHDNPGTDIPGGRGMGLSSTGLDKGPPPDKTKSQGAFKMLKKMGKRPQTSDQMLPGRYDPRGVRATKSDRGAIRPGSGTGLDKGPPEDMTKKQRGYKLLEESDVRPQTPDDLLRDRFDPKKAFSNGGKKKKKMKARRAIKACHDIKQMLQSV